MGYITLDYYTNTFHGHPISADAFPRLADDAGMMIDSIVQRPVGDADKAGDLFKRAVCYQTEVLALAGGVPALAEGEANGRLLSVSNDGYSEHRERIKEAHTLNGLPVSSMAMATLQQMGYLKRWVYAGRETP
jgi:hypothetical protein